MSQLSSAVLEAFKEFDSPTIFNAVVLKLGLPNEDYTDHQIRCLLPELVPVIGYAVTVEVTSNDSGFGGGALGRLLRTDRCDTRASDRGDEGCGLAARTRR